jgi:hypothetical protein
MSDKELETIEKSKYEADLQKAAQEKAELEEIQKGLQAELEEFRKAKQEAEKAEFIQKAKGFEVAGIGEDKVEAMAVALQKASKDEDMKILVDSFTKYVELSKSLEGEKEQGHGADLSATSSTVADILKANQAKKSK